MISDICGDILGTLSGIAGVKYVGAWTGDVESLMKTPQNLPGLYLVYQRAQFADKPAVMGANSVDVSIAIQILLIIQSMKAASAASDMAWTIMEDVRARLIGRRLLPSVAFPLPPVLWPNNEELVFSEGGLLVYGLNYHIETRI
jgi:hypothetical protein